MSLRIPFKSKKIGFRNRRTSYRTRRDRYKRFRMRTSVSRTDWMAHWVTLKISRRSSKKWRNCLSNTKLSFKHSRTNGINTSSK